jgi:glycosyltransferase involved in cell wall biosynthesis
MEKIIHVVCNPSTGVLSLISSLMKEQTSNHARDYKYSILVIYDNQIDISKVKLAFDGFEINTYYSPIKINTIFYFFFYLITTAVPIFNGKNNFYHFHNAQMSAAFLHHKNSRNSLITIHGFLAVDRFKSNSKGLIKWLHTLFFKRIVKHGFTTSSVDMDGLNKIENCFNIKLNQKLVIPNCASKNQFLGNSKQQARKFVFLGAIDENKGIEYVVEAFDKSLLNYELHVFGIGEKLNDLTRKYRHNACIYFYGGLENSEIQKLLVNFDVYISFSRKEGLSMSFIEALAAGLAVISTDWGDVKEYINGNGYLVKRDIENLQISIKEFCGMDLDKLRSMKYASIEIYNQKFNPSIIMEKYLELYEQNN